MPNYESLYFQLFSAISDALDAMDASNYDQAKTISTWSRQRGEEQYIDAGQAKIPGRTSSCELVRPRVFPVGFSGNFYLNCSTSAATFSLQRPQWVPAPVAS